MKLWSINRWLRYTGFRVIVGVPSTIFELDGQRANASVATPFVETNFRVRWVGLPGSAGWLKWEPKPDTRRLPKHDWQHVSIGQRKRSTA